MKHIFIFFIIIGTSLSCESTHENCVELLGRWQLIGICFDCPIFEFIDQEKLVIHDGDHSNEYNYRLYYDNTIEIDFGTQDGRYDIVAYTIDSIEIIGFTISGIPEEFNTLLKRIDQ